MASRFGGIPIDDNAPMPSIADMGGSKFGGIPVQSPAIDQPIMRPGDIDHSNLNQAQQAAAEELKRRGRLKSIVASGVHYLRPTFEGLASAGAAIGGTALGAVTGPFAPAVGAAAAAGAYTATKQGLDRLEEWATLPEDIKTAPPMQQMKQTMEDFRAGLLFELGGPAAIQGIKNAGKNAAAGYGNVKENIMAIVNENAAEGAPGGFKKIMDLVRKNTPALSESAVSKRAAEIIQEHRGNLEQYDINIEEARKVAKELGTSFDLAQQSGDPGLIKYKRGAETQKGIAAEMGETQKNKQIGDIQDYLKKSFPGNATIDDVLTELETQGTTLRTGRETAETAAQATERSIPTETPQVTGQNITEAISEAQAPLKKIEKEYWDKVPDYEMTPTETESIFNELVDEPSQAQKTVKTFFKDYKNRPKTIKGLQTTERELNDVIFDPNASPTVKRALGKIKTAINKDFAELGEAAERGDFATIDGKVVHPKKLQEELATIESKLIKEGAELSPDKIDSAQLYKELQKAKTPGIMQQKGEDKAGWTARIAKDYTQKFKKQPPMIPGEEKPIVTSLKNRKGMIESTLSNAEPAKNAGIAYANAKAFSKSQITDKFRKGVVAELEAQGKFQAGKRLPAEARPKKLMDVESADKFIDAVGKEKASDIMLRHYADDMSTKVKYDKDGFMESASLSRWKRKNSKVLERYGIEKEFSTVDSAHKIMQEARIAEKEFNNSIAAKMLNSDPQNAMQQALTGGEGISSKNTGAIMRNLLKRVEGNPQAIEGLQNGFKDFMYEQIKTTAQTLSGEQTLLSKSALDKAMRRFAPAQAILYKNHPDKLKALKTVQKGLFIINRTAKGVTGGSDTSEKMGIIASIWGNLLKVPMAKQSVKLASLGLGALKNLNVQEVTDMTAKMLYDPELAKIIDKAAIKNPPVKLINAELKNYMERSVITAARTISNNKEKK